MPTRPTSSIRYPPRNGCYDILRRRMRESSLDGAFGSLVSAAFKDLVQPDSARRRLMLQRGFMLEQLATEHRRTPYVEEWILRPWRTHDAVRQLDAYAAFIAGQPPDSNDFVTTSLREESRFMDRRMAILTCEYRLVAGDSSECVP